MSVNIHTHPSKQDPLAGGPTRPIWGAKSWTNRLTEPFQLARWLAVAFILLTATYPLAAQDAVHSRNLESGQVVVRKGRIVQWRGGALRLEANSSTRDIANESIVLVETAWNEHYLLAQSLIAERNFAAATSALQTAVADEPREWARHIAQADLVRLLEFQGEPQSAAEHFLRIIADDPQTRFYWVIPLDWRGGDIPPALMAMARQWREAKSPWLSLLGASWTLSGGDQLIAAKVLEQWSQDIQPQIAHLASAQLWRLQQLTAKAPEINRWEKQWERMPFEIQAGPASMIAMAKQRQGQLDDAVLWFLRIPILHGQQYQLSAAALQQAAGILKNQQQNAAAQRLWMEIIRDFPDTTAAQDAQKSIQSLEQGR